MTTITVYRFEKPLGTRIHLVDAKFNLLVSVLGLDYFYTINESRIDKVGSNLIILQCGRRLNNNTYMEIGVIMMMNLYK